jgi:hypothetical protein
MTARRHRRHAAHRLAWLTLAITWLGGLTFYAAIVVPIGAEITSSTTQGFVTQRVTFWLNLLGTGYVAVTAGDLTGRSNRGRQCLWVVLAAAQSSLWLLHPVLGRMLDPATLSLSEVDAFYQWHRLYLVATAIQWGAGVAHVGLKYSQDSDTIA